MILRDELRYHVYRMISQVDRLDRSTLGFYGMSCMNAMLQNLSDVEFGWALQYAVAPCS